MFVLISRFVLFCFGSFDDVDAYDDDDHHCVHYIGDCKMNRRPVLDCLFCFGLVFFDDVDANDDDDDW